MKGMLVQMAKGNLDNGLLFYNDLREKMDETVEKLKRLYGRAFETEGGRQEQLTHSTFVSANFCIYPVCCKHFGNYIIFGQY
jgi:hypothetical protein